jgi:hypothetical protein
MKKQLMIVATALFLAGSGARAEFRQIDLTIFGMD